MVVILEGCEATDRQRTSFITEKLHPVPRAIEDICRESSLAFDHSEASLWGVFFEETSSGFISPKVNFFSQTSMRITRRVQKVNYEARSESRFRLGTSSLKI